MEKHWPPLSRAAANRAEGTLQSEDCPLCARHWPKRLSCLPKLESLTMHRFRMTYLYFRIFITQLQSKVVKAINLLLITPCAQSPAQYLAYNRYLINMCSGEINDLNETHIQNFVEVLPSPLKSILPIISILNNQNTYTIS